MSNSSFRPSLPKWVTLDKLGRADLFNQLQINDINQQAVFESLQNYANKYNTTTISIARLYQEVQKFAEQHDYKNLKVNINALRAIEGVYTILYKKGFCSVKKKEDGKVSALVLEEQDPLSSEELQSIIEKLEAAYKAINSQIPKSFPSRDFLPNLSLSKKTVHSIALDQLSAIKIQELSNESPLIEIFIPNQKSVLISQKLLPQIYKIALIILKYYVRRPEIGRSPLVLKIKKQFPNLAKLKTTVDLIRDDYTEAQYWVTLTTEMIDLAKDKREEVFIQAAFLIKNYWIQKNEEEYRLKKKVRTMESLVHIMEKNTRPLKKSALLDLYHKSSLFQEYKEHEFVQIIGEFLQNFSNADAFDAPPIIFAIKNNKEPLYIHHIHIINLMDQEIQRLSLVLKNKFKMEWKKILLAFDETLEMTEPRNFEKYIEHYISEQSPFYDRLLHNPLLLHNIFIEISKKTPAVMKRAPLYFNHLNQNSSTPTLKPMSEILSLDREILLKEVKSSLPFSYRFPIFRLLLGFWKKLTARKQKNNSHGSSSLKQKRPVHNESVSSKKSIVTQEQSVEHRRKIKQNLQIYRKKLLHGGDFKEQLQTYEKRWNRSLSEDAKKDNRLIIRNLINSRLRYIFTPSQEKIEQIASDMLSTEPVLKKIQDQEAIRLYIILYITEYLNKKYSK